MKSLSQQYDQLIDELQSHQAQIAHVSRAIYHEHQRIIDQAGAKVIAFEVEHGIDQARHLLEHERLVLPQLRQFTEMLATYREPLQIDMTTVTPEEIERQTSERSEIVFQAKRSVETLTRMKTDCDARRKKLSKEALEIAGHRDPLNGYERQIFTELFNLTKGERATREVVTMKELAGV